MMPHEVAATLPEVPRDMDCALPLDEPDHLRHRVFWRDRDHHMNVVGHQMPFLDLALLLTSETSKHVSQFAPDLPVELLSAVLRNEDDVVFTVPLRVL
jgi:hypothetical protein